VEKAEKREQLVKNVHRIAWIVLAGCALAAGPAVSVVNHAFDVDAAGAIVCLDGVVFAGEATGASALNTVMTSQVFDQLGTTLLATGDTHTFTSVSETFTFTVVYPSTTFNVGDPIGLSVTDNPPTLSGMEGDFANSATVANCSLATVPTMSAWAFAVLALLLAAGGATMAATRGGKAAGA